MLSKAWLLLANFAAGLGLDPEMPSHVGMLQLLAELGVLEKEGHEK